VGDSERDRAGSASAARSVSWDRIGTISSGVSYDSCEMEAYRATKLSQWTTRIADRALRASQGDDDGITRSAMSAMDPCCDLGCWTLLVVAAACSFVRDEGPCRSSHDLSRRHVDRRDSSCPRHYFTSSYCHCRFALVLQRRSATFAAVSWIAARMIHLVVAD